MKQLNKLAKKGEINEEASIRDSHSTVINADISKVWDILTDIPRWSNWNSDIKKIKLKDNEIKVSSYFSWSHRRYIANAQIQSMDKPSLFSWTERTNCAKRINVWSLEADENQTIATVKCSIQGVFVVFQNHQHIYDELLNWLESLKKKSEE